MIIGGLITLGRRRTEIQRRIVEHRQRMTTTGRRLAGRAEAYLGTPNALLQSFLAGFLIDQARPILAGRLQIRFLRRLLRPFLPHLPALSSFFPPPSRNARTPASVSSSNDS